MSGQPTNTDSNTERKRVFGILAGEASGDILGAGLITELKRRFPTAEFIGIGGPLMQQQGLISLHNMERLSVMGFIDPIKRLPELLKIRASIVNYFKTNPPDVFIGIDAPDFNLGVEKRLKKTGIKTVHYVSPSVWAWRQWRIKKIKAATDKVLCVFPFEVDFYDKHSHPATFVGHPMADDVPLEIDKSLAKKALGLEESGLTVAILPGSRSKEVELLGALFMQVAQQVWEYTDVQEIVIAASSEQSYKRIQALAEETGVHVRVFLGRAREVLLAADIALAASGTVTLEAMFTKTPHVVAYRLEKLSYQIAKQLVKLKYIALPNILADQELVPEFIQDDVTVASLVDEMRSLAGDEPRRKNICTSFEELHSSLKKNASFSAAEAVAELIQAND